MTVATETSRHYDPYYNQQQTQQDIDSSENITIKGFPYPFDRKDIRGFMHTALNYEAIKASLLQLLMTEPIERVMMPSFGTGIRRYLFEYKDNISCSQLKEIILKQISRWEPRIIVRELNVVPGDSNPNEKRIPQELQSNSIIISLKYSLIKDLANVEALDMRVNF